MDRISEIMIKELVCCETTTKLSVSNNLMEKYECSRIPVIDKNQKIIGAIGVSDFEEGNEIVIDFMTREMRAVDTDSTVSDCLRVMILENVDQVPVIDKQGHFRGVVTQKILLMC